MKRLFKLLFLSTLFLVSSCTSNVDDKKEEVTTETVEKVKAPELGVEVNKDMNFFKDGYEIVEVESYGDGDTTNFKLKDGVFPVRYLAIDTPETSNGLDPWGKAAKTYVNDLLKNGKTIVLERDPVLISNEPGEELSTLDKYNRLLAHVWVDGELVQFKVVNESLAYVKYLYQDYKYNNDLISLESYVREHDNRRIHNSEDLDPDYDYTNKIVETNLSEINDSWIGKNVSFDAVVTGLIGINAYVQSGDSAIFIYTNHQKRKNLEVGNLVNIQGGVAMYNGQLQISNLIESPKLIETDQKVEPTIITVDQLVKKNESKLVQINDVKIISINGQNVTGDLEGQQFTIRFDSDVLNVVKPEMLKIGSTYDLIGNVGIYNDNVQLMIRSDKDIK